MKSQHFKNIILITLDNFIHSLADMRNRRDGLRGDMKQEPFHFGRWLKREIAMRELSVTAFSSHAGVSAAAIWSWLGSPAPSIRGDYIARLSRALGISYEQLEAKLHAAREAQPATSAA